MSRPSGSLANKDSLAISGRLRRFARRFGSQTEFADRFGVPVSTLRGWTRREEPSVPDVAYLLQLAREGNVSLDWLLLGAGAELREPEGQASQGDVLNAILAELRATETASQAEHEQAGVHLLGDREAAFRLAVDAIRPFYRRLLADLRTLAVFRRELDQLRESALFDGYEDDTYAAMAIHEFSTRMETALRAGYNLQPNKGE